MKHNVNIAPKKGLSVAYNRNIEGRMQLYGEFTQTDDKPLMSYRQIRLTIDRDTMDDKFVNLLIRADSPYGLLSFDTQQLLSMQNGFHLFDISTVDDKGNFVLNGTTDHGPFALAISTNYEGLNFGPMPGLLVTEVHLPLMDNDWSRD